MREQGLGVFRLSVICICSCWLSVFPALAQNFTVELTTLPPLLARPGEFVTVVFEIANRSPLPDTFQLELSLPEGFSLIDALSSIALPPQAKELVFATVIVPQDAAAGDYSLTLTTTSNAHPAAGVSTTAVIRVLETASLSLKPLEGQTAVGGRIARRFALTNRGNAAVTIALQATSHSGFSVEVSPQQVTLNAGDQGIATVSVQVPAQSGTRQTQDTITVTATSTAFPNVSVQASATLTLLPPPAEQVGTTLVWKMPSQEALSFSVSSQGDDVREFSALSSFRGGGFFAESHRLSSRLDVDEDFAVRAVLLELDAPLIRVSVGDVSAAFGEFTGVAGRGGLLALRAIALPAQSQLTLVGVPMQGAASWGGGVAISTADLGIGVSVVSELAQGQERTIGALRLQGQFQRSASASAQVALSHLAGLWDRAFQLAGGFTVMPLNLGLTFMELGPDFSGADLDQQKLELTQALALENLSIQSSLGFGRSYSSADPLTPTRASNQARLVFRAFPGTAFPSIFASISYQSQREVPGPPSATTQKFSGLLSVRQPLDVASVALSARLDRALDRLANTDEGSLEISSLLGWSAGGFSRSIELGVQWTLDPAAGLITDQVFKVTTALSLRTPGGTLSARMAAVGPKAEVLASWVGKVEATQFALSAGMTFVEGKPTDVRASASIGQQFDLPIPFVIVKGQIEGFIFADANQNGRPDAGEGLADVVLASGGARAVSNAQGFFRFPPFAPGSYALSAERLPAALVPAGELPQAVGVEAGQRVRIHLPFRRISVLDGLVFHDRNQNANPDEAEEGIANVQVNLLSAQGKVIAQVRSTANGRFSFVDVAAGAYRVVLDQSTLPPRFALTTPAELSVTLAPQETPGVRFGVVESPPEIRITFAEPAAEFTFAPAQPRVGDVVTFDASNSSDPDGQIVTYSWDFDADGVSDAQGVVVEHAFAQAGPASVTLTATDNDGNVDQATKTLDVR